MFSSDRFLAESLHGRDRMLQLALLNLELTFIEPFIAAGDPPVATKCSHPEIETVEFSHERGVLVLAYWKRQDSQYVVGQAAANDVTLLVTSAPQAAQAFQITLGEIRGLKRREGLGGIRVTIPEFDTAAIIVLTTDTTLYSDCQERVQEIAAQAAAWQKELAEIQLAKTAEVSARLETSSSPAEMRALLDGARDFLGQSRHSLDQRAYREAYIQATRSLRHIRTAQHLHWETVVKSLPSPVSDPFAVSFYTLPESIRFQQGVASAAFGPNLVASGNFERDGNLDALGWVYQPFVNDSTLQGSAVLIGDQPHGGRRALALRVTPVDPRQPVVVAEHTRVAMVSPAVRVYPGQVARISGYVRVPKPIAGSVDGAMVWDSIGGEMLAQRFSTACDWQRFVLYRPIARPAELRVSLVMTGLGEVQFDDLLVQVSNEAPVPLAGRDYSDYRR